MSDDQAKLLCATALVIAVAGLCVWTGDGKPILYVLGMLLTLIMLGFFD